MQARSARSYIRSTIAGAFGWFDLEDSIHIGKGDRLKIGEMYGHGETLFMDVFSLALAFVTRPADRALKSVLKTRKKKNTSLADAVEYFAPYHDEYLKCLSTISSFRSCICSLLDWRDVPPSRIDDMADEYTMAAYLALLSARSNVGCTCRQRQLEKMAMVENVIAFTSQIAPEQRKAIIKEEIESALTSTTVMSSQPETAAAAMIQTEQFESVLPDEEPARFVQRVIHWLRKCSLKEMHSALVERLHGLWVKTAAALKISDVPSCGIRVCAQNATRSFSRIGRFDKIMRKLHDKIDDIESSTCKEQTATKVEMGFWHFKSANSQRMMDGEGEKFSQGDEGDGGVGGVMAEWMMKSKMEKEELGAQWESDRMSEFVSEKSRSLNNAKMAAANLDGKSERDVLRAWYGTVKGRARIIFRGWEDGHKKSRDKWSDYCSWKELEGSEEILRVWREEPSLMVAYVSRMAYLLSTPLTNETKKEHLEKIPLADGDLISAHQKKNVILQTNWNPTNSSMGPTLDYFYLVTYASTSPCTFGCLKLKSVKTEFAPDDEYAHNIPTFLVNDADEPEILIGGDAIGARFTMWTAKALATGYDGIYQFYCGDSLFEQQEALSLCEKKEGRRLVPEKKKRKGGGVKDEEEKKTRESAKRYMEKKIKIVRASDRIY